MPRAPRPDDGQLNLPPALLANRTQPGPVRPKDTQGSVETAHALAGTLFDETCTEAKLSSQEIAYLLTISESLVRRMRSPNARERVSFVQWCRLPVQFHWAYHRVMNRRQGFGLQSLREVLSEFGDAVALAVGK